MEALAPYVPLATLITLLIATGTVLLRLEQRFNRVERRLERVERSADQMNTWAAGFSREVNQFFGVVVRLLSNRQALTAEEMGMVTAGLTGLAHPAAETLFEHERLARNPLAPDELARLEAYYARVGRGDILSPHKAADYNRLIAVLQKENPSHPGIWPLVALGAFLTGLWLGQRDQDS